MGHHEEEPLDYTDYYGTEWKVGTAPRGTVCYWCDGHLKSAALVDEENDHYMHVDCWFSHDGFRRAMNKDD